MAQTYFVILLLIISSLNIFVYLSQQCTTRYIQKYLDGRLADTDYKPLLSLEEDSYGKALGKCVLYCDNDQRCLGFDLCKIRENLFRCRTCCEWKKIKGFTIGNYSNCKRIEKVSGEVK